MPHYFDKPASNTGFWKFSLQSAAIWWAAAIVAFMPRGTVDHAIVEVPAKLLLYGLSTFLLFGLLSLPTTGMLWEWGTTPFRAAGIVMTGAILPSFLFGVATYWLLLPHFAFVGLIGGLFSGLLRISRSNGHTTTPHASGFLKFSVCSAMIWIVIDDWNYLASSGPPRHLFLPGTSWFYLQVLLFIPALSSLPTALLLWKWGSRTGRAVTIGCLSGLIPLILLWILSRPWSAPPPGNAPAAALTLQPLINACVAGAFSGIVRMTVRCPSDP